MGLSARRTALRRDRALIAAARGLERHGLVVGTVGNVSVRDGDRVRITPTKAPYDRLRPHDLVTVDLAGRRWEGRRHPSRELAMHLAIYHAREDVHAIVHAHGTHAVAWSFLGGPLEPAIEEASYYEIGTVRCSPPAPAGSDELGRSAAAALGGSSAALLGGHGLVAVGADPAAALLVARVVEHHARVALLVRGAARAESGASGGGACGGGAGSGDSGARGGGALGSGAGGGDSGARGGALGGGAEGGGAAPGRPVRRPSAVSDILSA